MNAMRPELEQALRDYPGGIGKVIRVLRAAPDMERVIRDLAYTGFAGLPEEISEPAKAVLDVLDGGDGRIYT